MLVNNVIIIIIIIIYFQTIIKDKNSKTLHTNLSDHRFQPQD